MTKKCFSHVRRNAKAEVVTYDFWRHGNLDRMPVSDPAKIKGVNESVKKLTLRTPWD
jgi:hypothetical protein